MPKLQLNRRWGLIASPRKLLMQLVIHARISINAAWWWHHISIFHPTDNLCDFGKDCKYEENSLYVSLFQLVCKLSITLSNIGLTGKIICITTLPPCGMTAPCGICVGCNVYLAPRHLLTTGHPAAGVFLDVKRTDFQTNVNNHRSAVVQIMWPGAVVINLTQWYLGALNEILDK